MFLISAPPCRRPHQAGVSAAPRVPGGGAGQLLAVGGGLGQDQQRRQHLPRPQPARGHPHQQPGVQEELRGHHQGGRHTI